MSKFWLRWFNWPFVLLVQAFLVFSVFSPLLLHPGKFLIANASTDWLKNYFTYQAYLQQPHAAGVLKFTQFNYPYGDYIIYTDNSPLLALLVKLFSENIYDVSAQGLFIYHLFLLSGILLSTVLVYKILVFLIQNRFCIVFFSLVLPWLNPQLFRLGGHFSLSFSLVVLLGILFLLRSHQRFYADKNIIRELYWFVPTLVAASFIHLYYLVLVLVLVGYFGAAWVLKAFFRGNNYRLLVAWSGVAVVVPLGMVYGLIRLIDGYYALRLDGATGYSFDRNKLHLLSLFTAYKHNQLNFNYYLKPNNYGDWETYGYLGGFALYTGCGLLVFWLVWYFFRSGPLSQQLNKSNDNGSFLLLLGLASFGSLFIALGDYFSLFNSNINVPNYFNSFRYLKKTTEKVTHFRALGRFGWVFFWFFNFWVIYYFDRLISRPQNAIIKAVAYAFVLLAVIDTWDALRFYRAGVQENNLTNLAIIKELVLEPNISLKSFQAILPIPFYHIGSEVNALILTVPEDFQTKTIQLALATNLPLIASQMSRTAPAQVEELTHFITDEPSPALKAKLNGKPILVAVDTTLYNHHVKYCKAILFRSPCHVYEAGGTFVQRHQLQPIGSFRNLILYSYKF